MVQLGDLAPDFCLPSGNENQVCLSAFRGKWTVLYFYPKDNTSGCTREAMDFTESLEVFRALGADVIGVSKDSPASHRKFADRHGLKVTLLSDADHKVMEAYDVWALKKVYGKENFGIVRSTFIIDPKGKIARSWRSVKVKGHIDEVIKALEELRSR
jgi:peroxiredoxin Q/BCP